MGSGGYKRAAELLSYRAAELRDGSAWRGEKVRVLVKRGIRRATELRSIFSHEGRKD